MLNGQPLTKVRYYTEPVTLLISGNHCEEISFHLIDTPQVPIVLGYPWLVKHKLWIDWTNNTILGWSTLFLSQYLFISLVARWCHEASGGVSTPVHSVS